MRQLGSVATVCAAMLYAATAWAVAGDPDPSFGTGGSAVVVVGDYSHALALVRLPDGSLVAGGEVRPVGDPLLHFLVARVLPDGTPDVAFGTGGVVITEAPDGRPSRVSALLAQPDGRIVAVGSIRPDAPDGDVMLVRYLTDGSLDPSFGSGGIVVTDVAGDADGARSALLQPDGAIVVVGYSDSAGPGTRDLLVLRYDTDGVPDPTFGTAGIRTVDVGGHDRGWDVALQPDGRIVVVGNTASPTPPYRVPGSAIALRLLADGSLDGTFGVGGIATVSVDPYSYFLYVARLSDGDLFLSGGSSVDGFSGFGLLARLDPAGALDPAFGGGDGTVTLTGGPVVFDLASDAQDRAIAATSGFLWGHWSVFGAARFLGDGTLDPTFGNGGRAGLWQGPGYYGSGALALAEDPDGSAITVAGFALPEPFSQGQDRRQLAFARFLAASPACASDADCGACEYCTTSGVCANGPRPSCTRPTTKGAKITYYGGPVKPRIAWRWKSRIDALGFDPVGGDDVGFCMWWGTTGVYESSVPGGNGWIPTSSGARYRDAAGSRFGITDIKLGRAGITLNAKGDAIEDNPHGFADALLQPGDDTIPLHVQLHASNGVCYAATYQQTAFKNTYGNHRRTGVGF